MKKVLLIFPPFTQPVTSRKRCLVPLGLLYVASYLQKFDIDVSIHDSVVEGYENDIIHNGMRTFGTLFDEIKDIISKADPDFVGVSCLMTQQKDNAHKVLQMAKEVNPNIHTVMGGCHPSALPKETLAHKEVDSVVIGEGEESMLKIVKKRTKGIVTSPKLDIDALPWLARELIPIEKYLKINMPENPFSKNKRVTQMITSRGCPFNCYFCSTVKFHGGWRGRKAESVIKEASYLVEQYDIDELNILDENFVANRERTVEIMKGIKKLDIAWSNPGGIWIQGLDNELLDLMKNAGCYQLTFPVETSNTKILHDTIRKPLKIEIIEPLVKHCRKIGIDTHAFFICGFPEQTKQDMINDFEYAKRVGFDSASFNLISPFPGSDLYYDYKYKINVDEANYATATIPHPTIPKKELEEMVNGFNIKFNKSLKWRRPLKYISKYYGTALRKYSLMDAKTLLGRQ
jgi:anaerobic magnesium-protoporphyrin IX monomethyl ester cyclase